MNDRGSNDALAVRRERLAQKMVLVLPGFGQWASTIRDFETPYGRAGIRQLEVLYMLRHDLLDREKPTATALSERFQIQRSVVTRLLTKLEVGGYIVRQPDPHDGRAQQITITESGKNLSDYVEREFFKEMEVALGEIEDEELACLERSIEILRRVSISLGNRDVERRVAERPNR